MVLIDPVTSNANPTSDSVDASTAATSSGNQASSSSGPGSDTFSAESTQSVGKTYSLDRESDETVSNFLTYISFQIPGSFSNSGRLSTLAILTAMGSSTVKLERMIWSRRTLCRIGECWSTRDGSHRRRLTRAGRRTTRTRTIRS